MGLWLRGAGIIGRGSFKGRRARGREAKEREREEAKRQRREQLEAHKRAAAEAVARERASEGGGGADKEGGKECSGTVDAMDVEVEVGQGEDEGARDNVTCVDVTGEEGQE
eukprot:3033905-Rhodomonas_salina.4